MEQQEVNAEQVSGTRDVTYDLVSVLYHALQGAENYAVYAKDAQESGESEVAQFFNQLVDEERRRAERTKELLKKRWSS
jgi:rubrerythrin